MVLRGYLSTADRRRGRGRTHLFSTSLPIALLGVLSLPLQAQEGPPPRFLLDSARNHFNLATYNRENAAGDPAPDYREAITYYRRYLEAVPELGIEDTAAIYEKLGECHFFLPEYDACLPYFQWVIDRAPENAYLAGDCLFAGYALWQTRGLEAALPYYARYVELMPDDHVQRRVLAGMYRGQSAWSEAADHYLILLGIDPADEEVLSALLNLRLRLPARFEEITLQLSEHHPQTPIYLLDMGRRCAEGGRYDEAVGYLRRYLEMRPEDITGWETLAAVFGRTGEVEEAIAALRRILDLEPGNIAARASIGEILVEEGRIEEAIREIERALALDADDPFANKVMGDAAREWILNRHRTEHPGESLENMRYNIRRFLKEIVADRYFEKARTDPRWRSYCESQIAWLTEFFPAPADLHMARPEDRVRITFPPPS